MSRFTVTVTLCVLVRVVVAAAAPFVLFASQPMVGHVSPLALEAAALWRRRESVNGLGTNARVVLATTAFVGSPHLAVADIFHSVEGDAYGTGVEYVEVGFVNTTADRLVNFTIVMQERVSGRATAAS
jgi:hypothetical protein